MEERDRKELSNGKITPVKKIKSLFTPSNKFYDK